MTSCSHASSFDVDIVLGYPRPAAMATASPHYTQKVPMTFANYLMDWMNDSKTVNILVSGKVGTGKSTLINSVLGTSVAAERHSVRQNPKRTRMARHQNLIGGIQVIMWDSPGLCQQADKAKTVEDIRRNCKNIDLCLFCVDMCTLRFNIPEYSEAMKELSEILGRDIWKHTLFVLTKANEYLIMIEDDHRNNPEGKKQKFEHQVGLWKRKLQSSLESQLKQKVKNVVVPVGDHHNQQLFPNDDSRWLNELWVQTISAVRHTAKPAGVKICQHLLRNTESDLEQQLSVLLTLQTQVTSDTIDSPRQCYTEAQETDPDDRPQGQAETNYFGT